MSGQILATELTAISQEAKRKHADIRTAADKSLQELKSLPSTSEQQLAADLSRRPAFIDPFVQGAISKNARLASSSIACLQRLIVVRGLPPSRLEAVLEAFNASTSLSLDVQLKVLQALPGLTQNYADHLSGDLLAAAIRVCAVLQNVKLPTISAVAAATLQQLVVSVFDKVTAEDAITRQTPAPAVAQIENDGSKIPVREAAFDAYRVMLDVAAASQGDKSSFLDLSNFPTHVGLELIHAVLTSHGGTFISHPELVKVIKDHVMPFLIRLLSDRQNFSITLRAMRIVPLIIQRHVTQMPEECEILLGLLTHLLEPDSSHPWKRVMVMEVFRAIYSTPGLVVQLYMQYDGPKGGKAIVRDNVSSFVRLSNEKPSLIGLGQQSTAPAQQTDQEDEELDGATIEAAGGMVGIISSSVSESNAPGISSQWSTPKVPMLDLLDKSDAPAMPDTYIYSLTLDCLNYLSDSLAKTILPLTMSQDGPNRRKTRSQQPSKDKGNGNGDEGELPTKKSGRLERSQSFRSSTMPVNPLTLDKIPAAPKVKAIAGLLEDCWPALLATSSTFLYCALDNELYRGLIRSFQRFTQVAGLLDLVTARDAFLTTLGKAAVPPNLTSSLVHSVPQSPGFGTPVSIQKALLSVNSALGGSPQTTAAGGRRPSHEPASATLTTRNLLCLRALVNLAIALGPTLKDSFAIILGTLQHADLCLEHTQRSGSSASLASLGQEIEAVRSASKRLMESTADYPNESFRYVLDIFCRSIEDDVTPSTAQSPIASRRPSGHEYGRRSSTIAAAQAETSLRTPDRYILLAKTGRLADVNISRFASYRPVESGWQRLAQCLVSTAAEVSHPRESRLAAADILCRSVVSLIKLSADESVDETGKVQKLGLTSLDRLVDELFELGDQLHQIDTAIYCRVLEAVRSAVETLGESLVVGWDIILRIVERVFITDIVRPSDDQDSSSLGIGLYNAAGSGTSTIKTGLVAPEAGRVSFAVVQAICSDFLPALQSSYVITVSDILLKFARQRTDVNMSLTAITLFSDVSAFLIKDNARFALESIASPRPDRSPQKIYESLRHGQKDSRAAQWIILLHQLSEVAADDRSEIRNGAFQMLLRILQDQPLDPHAFQFAFTNVLLKTLEQNADRQVASAKLATNGRTASPASADEASKALLDGIAHYLEQNMDTFEKTTHFDETWSKLMSIVGELLKLRSYSISQSVFAALTIILQAIPDVRKVWPAAISQVGSLWGQSFPTTTTSSDANDQQAAFIAYIGCATELVRLTAAQATAPQIKSIAGNAERCIQNSIPAKYGNDEKNMTDTQAASLKLLKSLRSDLEGAASMLVKTAANLIRLPFDDHEQQNEGSLKRPTFVALSKEAMSWLEQLLTRHSSQRDICTSSAANEALSALAIPIKLKYHFEKSGKPPPAWRLATDTALRVLPAILPNLSSTPEAQSSAVWDTVATLASAIMHGDYSPLPIPASFEAICRVEADEQLDATSLLALRDIILPHLGSARVPHRVRQRYAHALFSASIIHPLHPATHSSLLLSRPGTDAAPGIDLLLAPVRPRIHPIEPSRREDMAYLCLAELVSMASSSSSPPGSFAWHPSSAFTRAYVPGDYGGARDTTTTDHQSLAAAATPWLRARIAILVAGYVADQPLRSGGGMQISLREELCWVLARLEGMGRAAGGATAAAADDDADDAAHIDVADADDTAHPDGDGATGVVQDLLLRPLHPLLVRAVGVAGHPRHGDGEVLGALMGVLEVYGRGGT